ncbi:hypothetical protein H5410_003073 [Solanum commersonii]|uniref:Uncharacterized protein n=1 Tax=Solanum commersonii TaxID=4109 RepID=A0A9J6B400_SOLCO|nr:hypothetical protein H5410_003073 [Solanum commersonii]
MDGLVAGDKNSGGHTKDNLEIDGEETKGTFSTDDQIETLSSLTNNHQMELNELTYSHEDNGQGSYSQDHANSNGQRQSHLEIEEQRGKTPREQDVQRTNKNQRRHHDDSLHAAKEVIEVESNSQFSFGVKPRETNTNKEGQHNAGKESNITTTPTTNQMQGKQAVINEQQSKQSSEEGTSPGKYSNPNSSNNYICMSSSDDHAQVNINVQKAATLSEQGKGRKTNLRTRLVQQDNGEGNSNPNSYHDAFLNISMVQTFTARHKQNKVAQATYVELVPPKHKTKQG